MDNKIKVGDKVTCVLSGGAENALTLYKVYEVIDIIEGLIVVIDDIGDKSCFQSKRFKPFKSNKPTIPTSSDNTESTSSSPTPIIQLPVDINILGTVYTISIKSPEEDTYLDGIYGYCDFMTKSIVLRELDEFKSDMKAMKSQYETNLRHEIMHAFLYESGLDSSSIDGWARNEEMIDYMAIQLPKIFKVMCECKIL